jgi:hypothetical protein
MCRKRSAGKKLSDVGTLTATSASPIIKTQIGRTGPWTTMGWILKLGQGGRQGYLSQREVFHSPAGGSVLRENLAGGCLLRVLWVRGGIRNIIGIYG